MFFAPFALLVLLVTFLLSLLLLLLFLLCIFFLVRSYDTSCSLFRSFFHSFFFLFYSLFPLSVSVSSFLFLLAFAVSSVLLSCFFHYFAFNLFLYIFFSLTVFVFFHLIFQLYLIDLHSTSSYSLNEILILKLRWFRAYNFDGSQIPVITGGFELQTSHMQYSYLTR